MYKFLKILAAAAALVFVPMLCAYADDASDSADPFPYGNLKVFPHWLIACDNLEECSAIGYPFDPADKPIQPWYVTAKWKKNSDKVTFFTSYLWTTGDPEREKYLANLSFQLCVDNEQCRPITAGDGLQISTQPDPNDIIKILNFTVNMKNLTDKSYLIFNEYKDSPIYFGEFLQNHNSITINYLPELGGKQKIYNIKKIDDSLDGAEVKKLYPQYDSEDDNDDDIKNEQDCLSPNYAVEYENGDKFIFGCENGGYNAQVGKYDGKTYQNFNVVDDVTFSITGRGMAWDNLFGRIDFYGDDEKTFEVSNIGGRISDTCGFSYNFAYNGKKFIIETIRYMPLCIAINPEDWPTIYKRPS